MLSLNEKYYYFKACFLKCSSSLLEKSDEEIKYTIYEDVVIDIVSFVHRDTLELFLSEGMIDLDIYYMSLSFREKFMDLERRNFSAQKIRNSKDWKCLFSLSDEIITQLYF